MEDYSNCGLFEGGFSVHLNTISNFFVLLYSVHYTYTPIHAILVLLLFTTHIHHVSTTRYLKHI